MGHIRVSEQYVAEHPEADPVATEVVINVLVTGGRLLERLDAVLRPHGLTGSTFNVLQIVAGDPEPLTPTEIARRLPVAVTTATVTGLLDTASRRGLVERRPHPTDRRRVLVHLTPAGRALLRRVGPEVAEAEKGWVAALSPTGRQHLLRALGQLQDGLGALPG